MLQEYLKITYEIYEINMKYITSFMSEMIYKCEKILTHARAHTHTHIYIYIVNIFSMNKPVIF